MNIVFVLDLIGVGFLVLATFGGSIPRINSMAAGLSLIGFAHLILPTLS